jgi:hypothetical protein
MEELVAKTELEREAARLERELQDLEALLAEERERLSALSPMPVYWRQVRCGKACGGCPHGPYPYLKVKKEGEDGVARGLRRPRWGRRWGLARAVRPQGLSCSVPRPLGSPRRERKATRMRAKRPHRGYCRLRARGSGIWDRASRRVMPLLCLTSRVSVKSDPPHLGDTDVPCPVLPCAG